MLFLARDEENIGGDKYLGWKKYFAVNLIELQANHFTMFKGHSLQQISETISAICEY
jgi:hypothetical protein